MTGSTPQLPGEFGRGSLEREAASLSRLWGSEVSQWPTACRDSWAQAQQASSWTLFQGPVSLASAPCEEEPGDGGK